MSETMNGKVKFRPGFVKADPNKEITSDNLRRFPNIETPENSSSPMFERTRNNAILPEMLSIREASERTNLSRDFLRYLVGKGSIKYIKSGNRYLINSFSLAEYLNSLNEGS